MLDFNYNFLQYWSSSSNTWSLILVVFPSGTIIKLQTPTDSVLTGFKVRLSVLTLMDRVALMESSCSKVLICIEKLCHAGACVWFKFVTCHFLFCLFGLKCRTVSCLFALSETRKPGGLQGKSHKMGFSPHLCSRCSKVRLLFFFASVTAPSTEIQVLWFRHQMYNLHLK